RCGAASWVTPRCTRRCPCSIIRGRAFAPWPLRSRDISRSTAVRRISTVTPPDLTLMDALGWNLASSSNPPSSPPPDREANESPEPPTLTVANVGVPKNGSTSLPIAVQGVDPDDTVFVTIKGLNKYETITDGAD